MRSDRRLVEMLMTIDVTLLYGFIYNLPLILIKVLWCGSSHYDFLTSIFILKFYFKC